MTYSGTVSADVRGDAPRHPLGRLQPGGGGGVLVRAGRRASPATLVEILIEEQEQLPRDLLLNVNVPAGPIQGLSFTRLGRRVYKQSVIEKLDPRGRKYYWIAGTPQWEKASGTDYEAVSTGRISVTPLHLDLTYYPGLESFGALRDELDGLAFRRLSRPPAHERPVRRRSASGWSAT